MSADFALSCPRPLLRHLTVQMAHGGGGRAMRTLIEETFISAFANESLATRHDSAVLKEEEGRLAFTTDSFVVRPRFFPGGDIGELAVYGTVNDLAMAGATPRYLSVGMILEEGLALEELRRIVASMRRAAHRCGVQIVTGDTKVVEHGKGDGIFINTAGLGVVPGTRSVGPHRVVPGDVVLLSGDVGRHGIAIMSVREGLEFETLIESDCAPLHEQAHAACEAGDVHCMRDLTRGGLASALNEIALDGHVTIEVEEARIPVLPAVSGACEMLGLDPLYVANEGRMICFVAPKEADRVQSAMCASGAEAVAIGSVFAPCEPGRGTTLASVRLRGVLGQTRLLDLLSGEQLPRIC